MGFGGYEGYIGKSKKPGGKHQLKMHGDCDHRDDICKEWARYDWSFAESHHFFVHIHVQIRHAQEKVPRQSGKYYDYLS